MERTLSIMEIERFAVHDGPGIRTTIFLKGCPLHCPWCSNPESQKKKTQLLHLKNKCIGCGQCIEACAGCNITFKDHYPVFNRTYCIACRSCADACLQDAIRFSGDLLPVSQIMKTVLRDKDYYVNSNGGVTFSGGEAFVQFEGLMELLKCCKKEGLHTAVETCGHVETDKIKKALPLIDLFLFDVKHTGKDLLEKETGADSNLILANLGYIAGENTDKVTIRIPVIPGFNFNEKDICGIYKLAVKNRIKQVHLLPYHTLGKDKYEQLGLRYPYRYDRMLSKDDLIPLQDIGINMGLDVRIGG